MTESEVVKIAYAFAEKKGFNVGELVRVNPPGAVDAGRWSIVIKRIDPPGMELDPDVIIVAVDDRNGKAKLEQTL